MVSRAGEAWLPPSPFRPISITGHFDLSWEEPRERLGQKRKEEAVI